MTRYRNERKHGETRLERLQNTFGPLLSFLILSVFFSFGEPSDRISATELTTEEVEDDHDQRREGPVPTMCVVRSRYVHLLENTPRKEDELRRDVRALLVVRPEDLPQKEGTR